ncbi:hypothetical protein IEO21_07870 [Rhodonia placenta]|uniref:Uncharacterized protein n=1 Tax=Rhodonia placenta TaxID=104341 RepID=A0A8H7NXD1_9APHY|nr:hypothetical protein IEO21_07870 [Postia placenta]
MGPGRRGTNVNAMLPQNEKILGARLHVTPLNGVREVGALREDELSDPATGLVEPPPPEDGLRRVGQEARIGPRVGSPLLAMFERLGQCLCSTECRNHRVEPQELDDIVFRPATLFVKLLRAVIVRRRPQGRFWSFDSDSVRRQRRLD